MLLMILMEKKYLELFMKKNPKLPKIPKIPIITIQEFNKLTTENIAARLAEVNLACKNDIANLVKKADFDNKLKNLNELSEKSFLLGRMYFTSNDGFQKMFVYQPTFNTLKYKNTSTEYAISWKSKELYNSKHIELNCDLLLNIKYFY